MSAHRLTGLRQRLYAVTRARSTPAPVAALTRACWLSLEIAADAPRAAAVPRSIARFWWDLSQPAGPSGMWLLKVDAEGHDLAVLRGASAYLDALRPVVIVESWAKALKLRAFLADFGYRLYRYEDREGRLLEHGADESGQADLLALADRHLPELSARLGENAAPGAARPRIVGWV